MKVLLFYQHFWPDSPPYANMLRAIGGFLVGEGHTTSVLSSEPSYKSSDRNLQTTSVEVVDGVNVRRLGLLPGARAISAIRQLGKALWPLRALCVVVWDAFRGRRHDVVVAATIPPVANGLCGLLAARLTRAKFVYHLQDIYPEIGSAGGLWSEKSLRHRLLLAIDSFTCRHADKCIVLSKDMASALAHRGVNADSVRIINNFMLVDFASDQVAPTASSLPDSQGRFRLVFAGNLGRFQGLEALLQAFLNLPTEQDHLELHFLGDGVLRQNLIEMAEGHKRVFFHGHKPLEQARDFMASCDAGIVSIQPGIYRYAYPSKTLSYLGQGLPVFALAESESSLASEVQSLRLGVSVSNMNPDDLVAGFAELLNFLRSESNDRARIQETADSLYSRGVHMSHWCRLMNDLGSSGQPHISEKTI